MSTTTIIVNRELRRVSVQLPILGCRWLRELAETICGDNYVSDGEDGWIYICERGRRLEWRKERRAVRGAA